MENKYYDMFGDSYVFDKLSDAVRFLDDNDCRNDADAYEYIAKRVSVEKNISVSADTVNHVVSMHYLCEGEDDYEDDSLHVFYIRDTKMLSDLVLLLKVWDISSFSIDVKCTYIDVVLQYLEKNKFSVSDINYYPFGTICVVNI